MKTALLAGALTLWLGVAGAAAQRPHPFDLLTSVAVDGTGRVVGTDPIDPGTLRAWEEGEWRPWNLRAHFRRWSPQRVLGLSNGQLATLWHRDRGQWLVSWTRGTEILGHAEFAWQMNPTSEISLAEAADGAVWISGRSPLLWEVKPPSGQTEETSSAHCWDLRPWSQNPDAETWHPALVVTDASGGVWVWSFPETTNDGAGRIRALLRHEPGAPADAAWQRCARELHGAELPFRFVGAGPPGELWILDQTNVLHALHTATQELRPVVPRPAKPLFGLARIWPAQDGGLFVVAGTSTKPALWHWTKEAWTNVIPAETVTFADQFRTRQSLLQFPEGVLLGSREGLIWVPHSISPDGESPSWGEARMLDPGTGFPLLRVEQLLALPDGKIGVRASREAARRWWAGTLNDLLEERSLPDRVEWIRDSFGWAVDAEDRVYTILRADRKTLQEWSRGQWRAIPLPENHHASARRIEVDENQRVFIFPGRTTGSVLLLEKDRETWRVFPDFFTALRELGPAARSWQGDSGKFRPAITNDGKMAFLGENGHLHLWDGGNWIPWTIEEFFTPERLAQDPVEDQDRPWLQDPKKRVRMEGFGTPFVASNGRLAFNTRYSGVTWFWAGKNGWEPMEKDPFPEDPVFSSPRSTRSNRAPRRADVPARMRSVMEDNVGTTWIVAGGNLHRFREGVTMPIFAGEEVHPFLSEPSLEEVRVDRHGFVWLRTGSREMVVLSPSEQPDFQPRLTVAKDGMVRLREVPPGRIEWSLDEKHWNPARVEVLGFVPPDGPEIFLRLVTEDLSTHALPPQKIESAGSAAEFWAGLVNILLAGDYAQKILVLEACERNPEQAKRILRAALETEKPEDDWWLRAALQRAEKAAR